ncbi:MAG: hypothetical protein J6K13_09095 [Clostridia bacterium]|nr:hypothetical protein [Clostridia bacterium]
MRITFNCEYCNKETNQIPSVYNRSEHHYCSRECKQKARGYKIEVKCDYCDKIFSKNRSAKTKTNYCSKECHDKSLIKKINFNCDYCNKESSMIPYRFNKSEKHFCSEQCRNNYFCGENHKNYNPNLTDDDRIIGRNYQEYNDFIKNVLERDNYTCRITGQIGGDLQVHHLNGYNWYIEGRTDMNNAITLTKQVHNLFHSIYGKGNNTLEQFEEFLKNYKNNLYVNTEVI